ncbi:efflux transporter outer membrane subunit [Acidovorax sp. 210-6]|uniref:efflux transporter outer membrane subunit n=1 Tax=Acidovorax sp. 210-6 TaxID=2699468 RepID=UPI001389D5AF|nr:efflux transporter outer membrane subunit [Acidovorax sp. 210-6]NCU66553.1 efflux transporter outer membrane subunit [Acidovorax sp. 210-6]
MTIGLRWLDWRPVAGTLGLALLLQGCAHRAPVTSEAPGAALPVAWNAPLPAGVAVLPQADDLARWWERFGDPQLSALVAQALQAHPSALSAQAALRQARAQASVQAAGMLPDVTLSGSAQRSRSGGQTGNSFQVGLDAGWEPDLFGRLDAGVQASEADARAAQASLEQVHVSLSAEVALQYISLRSLQQRLAIAQRNLETQQQTLQITDWRVQAGLATSLVAEQARAAAEQTAAQVPQLQASLAQARHALAVLTGQAPAALDAALAAPQAVPQPSQALALDIPADTLRQRPDVRVAQERVQAALARVSQADAARYPSLRLSGSLGLRALTLGALGDSASLVHSLLGSVAVPLFDGGATQAQVQVQQAALEQARQAYQLAVLTALKEVEDALVALQGEAARLAHLQQAAQAAGNAALLAQQRYASGLIDFASVLETQRTQLATQDALATSQANLGSNHVRLFKALGGGWQ